MKPNQKSAVANLWKDAYETIQKLILSSQLKPGAIITEIGLSKQLGLGRTPVREALQKLEQEGLVVTENRRKRVFILTIKEIEDIFDLKICIESAVAQWAAERGEAAEFSQLSAIMNQMKTLAAARPANEPEEEAWFKKWMTLDAALHQCLFQMAANKRAEQIITNLNKQWHRLKVGLLAMEGRIEKSVIEHEKIVQAVLNQNGQEAFEAMHNHLQNLKRMLIRLLKFFNYPV